MRPRLRPHSLLQEEESEEEKARKEGEKERKKREKERREGRRREGAGAKGWTEEGRMDGGTGGDVGLVKIEYLIGLLLLTARDGDEQPSFFTRRSRPCWSSISSMLAFVFSFGLLAVVTLLVCSLC